MFGDSHIYDLMQNGIAHSAYFMHISGPRMANPWGEIVWGLRATYLRKYIRLGVVNWGDRSNA